MEMRVHNIMQDISQNLGDIVKPKVQNEIQKSRIELQWKQGYHQEVFGYFDTKNQPNVFATTPIIAQPTSMVSWSL